ncbi:ATP-dependent exonuclease, partial [Oxalobacteraceae bacterium OM1]
VHDLLDVILHEGDLVARYASAAQPAMRAQVLGNIEAFTELALNLDAGRYPSLPKFIEALRTLRQHAESDAPDEAAVDATVDAVRILTIHSAKGLEAGIVVLVDANHSDPARDDCGILCDWPQDSDAPTHFSCFARKDERGAARDHLFAAEEAFRMQEDWNLLYVAATRAKELLIVSGVAGSRGALPDGCVEGSWYHRLSHVDERVADAPADAPVARTSVGPAFELPIYSPAVLAADDGTAEETVRNDAIDEGIALHTLLERLTQFNVWPCRVPEPDRIARWLDCPPALAETIAARASRMLATAELERFFNPKHFRFARNELEVVDGETVVRFDRAVVFDDEVWILDYKRDLLDSERAGYGLQLQRYRDAAGCVFPGLRVRTAIITPDGRLSEFD